MPEITPAELDALNALRAKAGISIIVLSNDGDKQEYVTALHNAFPRLRETITRLTGELAAAQEREEDLRNDRDGAKYALERSEQFLADAQAELTTLRATVERKDQRIRDLLAAIDGRELNMNNYSHDDVSLLNEAYVMVFHDLESALSATGPECLASVKAGAIREWIGSIPPQEPATAPAAYWDGYDRGIIRLLNAAGEYADRLEAAAEESQNETR